jgi:cytochrome c5
VSQQDRTFVNAFKAVIIFLVALTFVIFLAAIFISGGQEEAQRQEPTYQKSVAQNIAPVGKVNVGEPGTSTTVAAAPSAPVTEQATGAAPAATASQPAAAQAPAGATGAPDLAQGEQVYTKACFACHGTGAAGAPKLDDKAAWEPRAAQGVDTLVQHAIQGFKAMPPKGGNPNLSDQEVRSAVAFMLDKAGIQAGQETAAAPAATATPSAQGTAEPAAPGSPEPTVAVTTAPATTTEPQPASEAQQPPAAESQASPAPASPAEAETAPAPAATAEAQLATAAPAAGAPAAERPKGQYDLARGEKVYSSACLTCHGTGVVGAPKLGDKAAWEPRIAQGMETLNQHAIQGFQGQTGVMPPKGGYTALSNVEVEDAVAYMVQQSR